MLVFSKCFVDELDKWKLFMRSRTAQLDDTTNLNSGSVQYHNVKQDIITISYLRKF